MSRQLQVKRGLFKDLPALNVAEFAATTDTDDVYIGSGAGNLRLPSQVDIDSINKAITKLVNASGITLTSPRYNFSSYIPAPVAAQQMEALVYIASDDVILASYKWYTADENQCSIVKYDRRTKKIIQIYSNLLLYHASDMTYNPNTEELFITTNTGVAYNDPAGANNVMVYNYPTMTWKRQFQYSYKYEVYGIAYRDDTNQFVFYDDANVRICDDNMVSQFVFNVPNGGKNYQNIEVYNNYILIYYDIAISIYDFQGNFVTMYDISGLDEGEGMCYLGGNKFLIGRVLMNHSPLCTQYSSRVYEFDITAPCVWSYNPYILASNECAYDKISVNDIAVLTAGVYTLGSNDAGEYDFIPNGSNEGKSIGYNTANNELLFNSNWDYFMQVSSDAMVQIGVSSSFDWMGAKNIGGGDFSLQMDYLTTAPNTGLEIGLCNNVNYAKANPVAITAARISFQWEFYVKSLNV